MAREPHGPRLVAEDRPVRAPGAPHYRYHLALPRARGGYPRAVWGVGPPLAAEPHNDRAPCHPCNPHQHPRGRRARKLREDPHRVEACAPDGCARAAARGTTSAMATRLALSSGWGTRAPPSASARCPSSTRQALRHRLGRPATVLTQGASLRSTVPLTPARRRGQETQTKGTGERARGERRAQLRMHAREERERQALALVVG